MRRHAQHLDLHPRQQTPRHALRRRYQRPDHFASSSIVLARAQRSRAATQSTRSSGTRSSPASATPSSARRASKHYKRALEGQPDRTHQPALARPVSHAARRRTANSASPPRNPGSSAQGRGCRAPAARMRRLQHVAAGAEHEIRWLRRLVDRARPCPSRSSTSVRGAGATAPLCPGKCRDTSRRPRAAARAISSPASLGGDVFPSPAGSAG